MKQWKRTWDAGTQAVVWMLCNGAVRYIWTDCSLGKIIQSNTHITIENPARVFTYHKPQYYSVCTHREQSLLIVLYRSTVHNRNNPDLNNDFELSLTGYILKARQHAPLTWFHKVYSWTKNKAGDCCPGILNIGWAYKINTFQLKEWCVVIECLRYKTGLLRNYSWPWPTSCQSQPRECLLEQPVLQDICLA